jgi:putative membrane protein
MKTILKSKVWASIVMLLIAAIGFAQQAPQLNDAEIAHVAVVANQIDIDYAKIAMDRSKNPEVREFAQTMIADHNAIIEQAVALVTKLGVEPQDNAVSQSLLKQAEATTKMLKAAKGVAFDKAYVDNEVAYHQAVIDAVKGVLIPQSQNAELKALLKVALPILETHLGHAKMAQSKISK